MQIRFVRNIQFSRIIKAEGRMREFNFRKPNGRDLAPCTVDTSDDRGQRIIFTMQKEGESWKIVSQQVPAWILQLEDRLSELIEEELQQY